MCLDKWGPDKRGFIIFIIYQSTCSNTIIVLGEVDQSTCAEGTSRYQGVLRPSNVGYLQRTCQGGQRTTARGSQEGISCQGNGCRFCWSFYINSDCFLTYPLKNVKLIDHTKLLQHIVCLLTYVLRTIPLNYCIGGQKAIYCFTKYEYIL